MLQTIQEILATDFPLRNSIYLSLIVGLGCPLAGLFLVLKRMVFMGVALPAISSTGIAIALSLHVWFGHMESAHGSTEQGLAFAGSVGMTIIAILWMAFSNKKQTHLAEGRIGVVYVLATAVSLIFLAKCPTAEQGWLNLFKGEILAVGVLDILRTGTLYTLCLGALLLFRKEFLLVSYDREMAITLGKRVFAWDLGLLLLLGSIIGVSVHSVGPLLTFGFMIVPPLIARSWVKSMGAFALLSSLIGGGAALAGFVISYHLDLPVGATDICVLGAIYLISSLKPKG